MSDNEGSITHREIYDRLVAVEHKVDTLHEETRGMVAAFKAAEGAFVLLEFLAKIARPLLWIGGLIVAAGAIWTTWWNK